MELNIQGKEIVMPLGRFKVGAHGFVYRWNKVSRSWLRTTMVTVWDLRRKFNEQT